MPWPRLEHSPGLTIQMDWLVMDMGHRQTIPGLFRGEGGEVLGVLDVVGERQVVEDVLLVEPPHVEEQGLLVAEVEVVLQVVVDLVVLQHRQLAQLGRVFGSEHVLAVGRVVGRGGVVQLGGHREDQLVLPQLAPDEVGILAFVHELPPPARLHHLPHQQPVVPLPHLAPVEWARLHEHAVLQVRAVQPVPQLRVPQLELRLSRVLLVLEVQLLAERPVLLQLEALALLLRQVLHRGRGLLLPLLPLLLLPLLPLLLLPLLLLPLLPLLRLLFLLLLQHRDRHDVRHPHQHLRRGQLLHELVLVQVRLAPLNETRRAREVLEDPLCVHLQRPQVRVRRLEHLLVRHLRLDRVDHLRRRLQVHRPHSLVPNA